MRSALLLLAVSLGCFGQTAGRPLYESEFILPLEHWHDHASCVVELPNGDLFACWYHGSGEKEADDVKIEAARLPRNQRAWTPRFTLADTPGFPDTNPALFLDSRQRLWLLWPVILANRWETALMKYRISSDYERPDRPPRWDAEDNILFIPRNFSGTVKATVDSWLAAAKLQPTARLDSWRRLLGRADDEYFSRLGWMTRVHPLQLPSGRILIPLYSDGYSFSIIAITDDFGQTWSSSEPLVGEGNIQPTIVRRRDGTLVAYMRDNGPPPKRVHISSSRDDGVTWSPVHDTDIPNPGAGIEAIVLRDGKWLFVYNDTERGRASLVAALSDDEGATWKWKRHLERDTRQRGAGSFHYPSVIQARDGTIHVTYSYFLNHLPPEAPRKSIKHAHFNEAWVVQGDQ